MLPINDLHQYLKHYWHLQRQVIHYGTNQIAYISGAASWQTTDEDDAICSLLYRETGIIQLPNYTGTATQTYCYMFTSSTVAEVHFSDGRFFYTLDLTTSHCEIQHPCGEDMYRGVFDAISDTTYQQIWRVTGPFKDYTSYTTLTRL